MPSFITEGTFPFPCPSAGKPCLTWYKVFGTLSNTKSTPLILIHGGPGLSSDYLICFEKYSKKYNTPVIIYDQIGNGKSTHLQEKAGDEEFWVEKLFISQLDHLIHDLGLGQLPQGYHLLGQSWGGMMGSTFVSTRPKGLKKAILSNSPASLALWLKAANQYLQEMPEKERLVIEEAERTGNREGKEYDEAMGLFESTHACTVEAPEEFMECMRWAQEDSTVSMTMNGPSEFVAKETGSHRNWSAIETCKKINIPVLVINGTNECATVEGVKPFLDGIPDVRWVKLNNSAHAPMFEEQERYFAVIADFLGAKEVQ